MFLFDTMSWNNANKLRECRKIVVVVFFSHINEFTLWNCLFDCYERDLIYRFRGRAAHWSSIGRHSHLNLWNFSFFILPHFNCRFIVFTINSEQLFEIFSIGFMMENSLQYWYFIMSPFFEFPRNSSINAGIICVLVYCRILVFFLCQKEN